jgi:hypothetical protein
MFSNLSVHFLLKSNATGFNQNMLLMRRPSEFSIPRQFWNESELKLYVGIVVVVLSNFELLQ